MKKQNLSTLTIWSTIWESEFHPRFKKRNEILDFLDVIPIQLYESLTEDSVDFLMNLGIHHKNIFNRKKGHREKLIRKEYHYLPHIFLFKGSKLLDSTLNHCYCVQGLTKMLIENAPNLIENMNLD